MREEFKLIRVNRAKQKTFDEYCSMAEYQNTITKMLVKDKFPYGNYGPLGEAELEKGKKAVDSFVFVGMNEMYDTSMVLLADALQIPMQPSDFDKERTANRVKAYANFLGELKTNATLQREIHDANAIDIGIYEHARAKFCRQLRTSPALVHPMIETELDSQNICFDLWQKAWGDGAAGMAEGGQ